MKVTIYYLFINAHYGNHYLRSFDTEKGLKDALTAIIKADVDTATEEGEAIMDNLDAGDVYGAFDFWESNNTTEDQHFHGKHTIELPAN